MAEVKQCPAGHTLIPWTSPRAGKCDGCQKTVSKGEQVLDCRACNWYLCGTCSPQETYDPFSQFAVAMNYEFEVMVSKINSLYSYMNCQCINPEQMSAMELEITEPVISDKKENALDNQVKRKAQPKEATQTVENLIEFDHPMPLPPAADAVAPLAPEKPLLDLSSGDHPVPSPLASNAVTPLEPEKPLLDLSAGDQTVLSPPVLSPPASNTVTSVVPENPLLDLTVGGQSVPSPPASTAVTPVVLESPLLDLSISDQPVPSQPASNVVTKMVPEKPPRNLSVDNHPVPPPPSTVISSVEPEAPLLDLN